MIFPFLIMLEKLCKLPFLWCCNTAVAIKRTCSWILQAWRGCLYMQCTKRTCGKSLYEWDLSNMTTKFLTSECNQRGLSITGLYWILTPWRQPLFLLKPYFIFTLWLSKNTSEISWMSKAANFLLELVLLLHGSINESIGYTHQYIQHSYSHFWKSCLYPIFSLEMLR